MVETKVEDLEILSNFCIQIFPRTVQNFGKNLKSNLLIPFLSLTSLSNLPSPSPVLCRRAELARHAAGHLCRHRAVPREPRRPASDHPRPVTSTRPRARHARALRRAARGPAFHHGRAAPPLKRPSPLQSLPSLICFAAACDTLI